MDTQSEKENVALALVFLFFLLTLFTMLPNPTPQPSPHLSLTLIFPMYNTQMVELLDTTLKPYIQPQDILYVNSGGTGTLNMAWVNTTIDRLSQSFSNNKIVGSTSGLENLGILASQVSLKAQTVNYNYEPNYDNIPEFNWDFALTLENIEQAKLIAQGNGKSLMVSPTGRPLLQSSLLQYAWDYGTIGQEADTQIIQTQTYCKKSTEEFQGAITKLISQYKGTLDGWAPQITVSQSNTNGVSAQRGYECTSLALDLGIDFISLWWNPNEPEYVEQYLKLLDR